MRTQTQRLVVFFAIVLSVSTGGGLRAGTISSVESLQPDAPVIVPLDVVASSAPAPCSAKSTDATSATDASSLPVCRNESRPSEEKSLCGSRLTDGNSQSTCDFSGLGGNNGTVPESPEPASPLGGDKAGSTGVVPPTSSRDQQAALPVCFVGCEQEPTSILSFPSSQSTPSAVSHGLFRPPRGS